MISCKRASELVSKQADQPLSMSESLALRFHLFICESCDKFRQQVDLLRRTFTGPRENLTEEGSEVPPIPSGAKERVLEKMREKLKS
ncbi:MAG: zf-HC2 domain-containing protein [Deltaproteobacteria bacterium]|nr:zf-HC2 domain-containing protein [Deltaproteobacteria bacterium]